MMQVILIHFNLKLKKVKDYGTLYSFLQNLSKGPVVSLNDCCYLLRSDKPVILIKELIKDLISPIDTVVLIELPAGIPYDHFGLSSDEVLDLSLILE